ncbi:hypothetical protein RHOSPDRAFT_32752 [Rhodotorula sp. JG-1b]|nr:hypothetical protein RHOSPDRAFT_32752 [Rhodotorula sp. JG-1b]
MSLSDSGTGSVRATFIQPARQRGPPPSAWKWELARSKRAVTTKNYHGFMAGRLMQFSYADEIGCYRRFEWLGDAALHPAYAKHLYHLFPQAGSGVLSTLRSELHSNATQAHLAYAFGLDLTVLEPPRPKNPKTIWKPLAQSQNIVADIFEAHIGPLAEEDREADIEDWVGAVLDRNKGCIRTRVTELLARADKSLLQANRKRPRDENEFEGGHEMDSDTKRRRHSFLPACPFELNPNQELPKWDDRPNGAGGWHSHLIFAGATIGCGGGKKRDPARQAATNSFFQIALRDKGMLSTIFAEPASAKAQVAL